MRFENMRIIYNINSEYANTHTHPCFTRHANDAIANKLRKDEIKQLPGPVQHKMTFMSIYICHYHIIM